MINFEPINHSAQLNMPMPSNIQFDFHYSDRIVYKDAPSTVGHIHPYYEMYIYLSGDIAFAVNNVLYKLEPGDIIFTSPNHFHHCVCLEKSHHHHYCFFFKKLDPIFFPTFEMLTGRVHLHYPEDVRDKILDACLTLFNLSSQKGECVEFNIISEFYRLLSLLCSDSSEQVVMNLPIQLKQILLYIGDHYSSIKNVDDLVNRFFLSQSTIERMFKRYLDITPYQYIENTRLAAASRSLASGCSVTESAIENGYSDSSHFIACFKKHFSMTPKQYQKSMQHNTRDKRN